MHPGVITEDSVYSEKRTCPQEEGSYIAAYAASPWGRSGGGAGPEEHLEPEAMNELLTPRMLMRPTNLRSLP